MKEIEGARKVLTSYDNPEKSKSNENCTIGSEEFVYAICSSVFDAVIVMDDDSKIYFWNSAASKIFGYKEDEVIGRTFYDVIIPKEQREAFREDFKNFKDPHSKGMIMELSSINKENVIFPIELSISYVKIKGQWFVISIVRDISSRRNAEIEKKKLWQQLLHSQKMEPVGRLTGGIAHDFNNLLTGILGYGELALNDLDEEHPATRKIRAVRRAGEKAAMLTQQLLAFSRKQVLNKKPSNLKLIIEDMKAIMTRVIGEDIKLDFDTDTETRNLMADKTQIEQVLMNLIVNARQAMPKGGVITIRTGNISIDESFTREHPGSKKGDYVMLSVKDTGTGMSEDVRVRIFEPYFTTKGDQQGTGLGLSTVYGIVKQHEGYILVDSEPGKGAEFKIFLPASDKLFLYRKKKEAAKLRGGTETIFVVDDDYMVRNLIIDTLEIKGYKVISAENGEEALKFLNNEEKNIDILLTDVVMTGMNGAELYHEIKKTRPDIKVIFTSGYFENPVLSNEIFEHKHPFLQKPITPSALLDKLKEVLDNNIK